MDGPDRSRGPPLNPGRFRRYGTVVLYPISCFPPLPLRPLVIRFRLLLLHYDNLGGGMIHRTPIGLPETDLGEQRGP